ncbi:DUF3800 domain-containing protein [Erythrobacter sp. SD-21]|uniref:DUF3800 domain-containing protein n=1 Tax=Erythrobacter sp. SD-21 TaxID=161528 RepID=UPI000153FB3B|nr:DUF3800 domain-containing protein [Erythrobacter sp. SD-21]EDL49707.1 hypothetical protein ED21_18952 [Erythrobacter sp. SD-21]
MKFVYVDESGARDQGDVFVMCGLMVDAYKLRKKTADFDARLEALFAKHPGNRADLKTSRFINGKGAWNQIDAQERKDFLTEVCALAVANGGKIFGVALSFEAFDAARAAGHGHPFGNSYWIAGGMFTSALVQKKMQGVANSKGLTVVIMDDNKAEMANLSDGLYACDGWYDGLYQCRVTKRKKRIWQPRSKKDRFDQIINTAFAIKSDHSSLVQVADAICYVYRRHLELRSQAEAYQGEQAYYQSLIDILEPHRVKIGQTPDAPCVDFYKGARHPEWAL